MLHHNSSFSYFIIILGKRYNIDVVHTTPNIGTASEVMVRMKEDKMLEVDLGYNYLQFTELVNTTHHGYRTKMAVIVLEYLYG